MIVPLPEHALILETERLLLSPMTMDDTEMAQSVLCDPQVMHFVADAMTPEEVVALMPDATRRGAGGRIGIWKVLRKETGEVIGDGVLTPVPIEQDETDWSTVVPEAYPPGQIEVGYLLVPSAWGQGFATELCARLLRFAFEQTMLDKVVATTDPDNANSQRVLQKCGMRPMGFRRAYAHDEVSWFEITRPEWQAQASNQ